MINVRRIWSMIASVTFLGQDRVADSVDLDANRRGWGPQLSLRQLSGASPLSDDLVHDSC